MAPSFHIRHFLFILLTICFLTFLASILFSTSSSSTSPSLRSNNDLASVAPSKKTNNNDDKPLSEFDDTNTTNQEDDPLLSPSSSSTKRTNNNFGTCTDNDVLRGFFGCQCGVDTLLTEPVNGHCIFGQAQKKLPETNQEFMQRRMKELQELKELIKKRNSSSKNKASSPIPLSSSSSSPNSGFACQEAPIRIAILGDETDFRAAARTNTNNDDNETSHLHGGFATNLLFQRRRNLLRTCRNDKSGAISVVPPAFWGHGFEGRGLVGATNSISTRFFTTRDSSIVDYENSVPLRKSLLFRPQVAILNLGSNEFSASAVSSTATAVMTGRVDQRSIDDSTITSDETMSHLLFDEYSKVIDRLIKRGSARRIILLTPPPSLNQKKQKFLADVVVPAIRRVAVDPLLNKLNQQVASPDSRIVLVDIFQEFTNSNNNKVSLLQQQIFENPRNDLSSVLNHKGNNMVSSLIMKTICSKCTKIPLPLPYELPPRKEDDDHLFAHDDHYFQNTEKTICPPGSTVDTVWGFNKPGLYNDNENYFGAAKNFGRWITSNDGDDDDNDNNNDAAVVFKNNEYSSTKKRVAFLKQFCRGEDDSGTSSNLIISKSNNSTSCEFINKPYSRLAPFAGPRSFSTQRAAALFVPRSRNDYQRKKFDYYYSASSLSSSGSGIVDQKNSIINNSSWCYDFQDPTKCLKGKVLLFIGDSHVVNMAQMLCRMLLRNNSIRNDLEETRRFKGRCGMLDIRFTTRVTSTYIQESNTTIAVFRLRYNISNQFHRLEQHPWYELFLRRTHFIFITRGMWDIVYRDTPKQEMLEELTSTLKFLAQTFKTARIIVKLLHYDHENMWGCSSDERQKSIRDVQICAAHRASRSFVEKNNDQHKQHQRRQKRASSAFSKFSIFDSLGMTQKLPYYTRKNNTAAARLGHHYQGSIQESLVQMMLSIMCPPQPQDFESLFRLRERYAEVSCRRAEDSSREKRNLACACSNTTLIRDDKNVTKGCSKFKSWNGVPFVVHM